MTEIDGQKTLLVYLDEAGDTYFGDSGTRFFLYTGLVLTGEGFPLHRALLECRYATIAAQGRFSNSHERNDYFHATEDSLETRERVFSTLKKHSNDARGYAAILEKAALAPNRQTPEELFQTAAKSLLSTLIATETRNASYSHVSIMLDSIPVQKKRKTIIGTLKRTLATALEGTGMSFTVTPMASKSDLALQAVDYYAWALYRKWESNDPSQLTRLGDGSIHAICVTPSQATTDPKKQNDPPSYP